MSRLSLWQQYLLGSASGMAALLVVGQLANLHSADERTGEAILEVDRTECDFGRVQQGEVKVAQFVLRNSGTGRLIVRKTNGHCECLSTADNYVLIPPRSQRTVVSQLDTRDMSGAVRIAVEYQTNSPKLSRLILACTADIHASSADIHASSADLVGENNLNAK